MLLENAFHLRRVHVDAAAENDVVGSVDDEEVPVVIDSAEVSDGVPALLRAG
jgi:hypothetical protein